MSLFVRLRVAVFLLCLLPALSAGAVPAAADSDRFEDILGSVVGIDVRIPATARSAAGLGTERNGSGVVIDDKGLVLTIGYLIMEASKVDLILHDGTRAPADAVAYDHNTGFGLLRARGPLKLKPARLGSSDDLKVGDGVIAVALGGPRPVTPGRVMSRREFAGYWEYLLPKAIFVSPPHLFYGGAALFNGEGGLVGIGSLFVNDAIEEGEGPNMGTMYVPIDALKPILEAMLRTGRGDGPNHPWLGLYTNERGGRVQVMRVAEGGPAMAAGISPGDLIIGVGGRPVTTVAQFYRRVWSVGEAGVEVSLDVLPVGSPDPVIKKVKVRSMDRYDWLHLNLKRQ